MSPAQAAPEDGFWYVPPRTEQAHRRRVERWLHAHPRVKVTADQILDWVYDVCDSLEEANYWVKETLWLLDYYLLVFPDKELAEDWDIAVHDGASAAGRFGNSDPEARAVTEAWVAKEGGVVPLPKHPPAIR